MISRTLLQAELRVRVPELCSMLELRSLTDERCVDFHPPSAAILVYDRSQPDAALVRAHGILQRQPTPVARVSGGSENRFDSETTRPARATCAVATVTSDRSPIGRSRWT